MADELEHNGDVDLAGLVAGRLSNNQRYSFSAFLEKYVQEIISSRKRIKITKERDEVEQD